MILFILHGLILSLPDTSSDDCEECWSVCNLDIKGKNLCELAGLSAYSWSDKDLAEPKVLYQLESSKLTFTKKFCKKKLKMKTSKQQSVSGKLIGNFVPAENATYNFSARFKHDITDIDYVNTFPIFSYRSSSNFIADFLVTSETKGDISCTYMTDDGCKAATSIGTTNCIECTRSATLIAGRYYRSYFGMKGTSYISYDRNLEIEVLYKKTSETEWHYIEGTVDTSSKDTVIIISCIGVAVVVAIAIFAVGWVIKRTRNKGGYPRRDSHSRSNISSQSSRRI